MSKLEDFRNPKVRIKRRIKMVLSILIIICGFAVIGLAVWDIIKIKSEETEEDPLDTEIEMIDLNDIPDEVPLEQSLEEWANRKNEKLTKEELYQQDISETFGKELKYKYIDIGLEEDLQRFTQDMCEKYEVDYPLILALMYTESSFSPAVGNEVILGGEEGGPRYYGYMQLSLHNVNKAKDILDVDAHTPKGNIEMAVYLMSEYLKKYNNDISMAIMAYKGGEGAADSWKEQGYELPIVSEILYLKGKYEEMLNEDIDYWRDAPND